MILLHRITPFALFLVCGAAFGLAMALPARSGFAALCAGLVLALLLLVRLVGWHPRTGAFWNLTFAPWLLFASGAGLFLLLEHPAQRVLIAAVVAILLFFFAEQVFAYVHAPAVYRAYAIQHLSLGMNVLTLFFLGAFGFGVRMFLQTPLYVLTPVVFAAAAYAMYQTLWVSKMEHRRALTYGAAGGLVLAELFVALTYLPTGFAVNAVVLALAGYLFLGLSRAWFLEQAERPLVLRYVAACVLLSLAVLATAQWR